MCTCWMNLKHEHFNSQENFKYIFRLLSVHIYGKLLMNAVRTTLQYSVGGCSECWEPVNRR